MSENSDYASVRAIEMRLFEEVGTQLKNLGSAIKGLAEDTRDVRERIIKIEAQYSPERLQNFESQIRELYERTNKIVADRVEAEHTRAASLSEYKLNVEKRLTRAEVIIAPLTAVGTAIITAIVVAVFKLI